MRLKRNPVTRSALLRLPGLLRRASHYASAGTVHKLRTTIRRAETFLRVRANSDPSKLLKGLKRIRRRAGRVRDIDVQLDILKTFGRRNDADVVSVRQSLAKVRTKRAHKLSKSIQSEFEGDYAEFMRATVSHDGSGGEAPKIDLHKIADDFMSRLNAQELNASNLHGFRIACKRLRYRAELAPESEVRDRLIEPLKRIQDAIGLWHDFAMLVNSSEDVLGAGAGTRLLRHLHVQTHSKYLDSLATVRTSAGVIGRLFAPSSVRKPSRSEATQSQKIASA